MCQIKLRLRILAQLVQYFAQVTVTQVVVTILTLEKKCYMTCMINKLCANYILHLVKQAS